mmetsp:Transcript_24490/g.27018  ORF Transcript_24490/g.27018 Transcript_24490/m.27018 type:complete len:107 (-) Transcript_24490:2502-2822(-)
MLGGMSGTTSMDAFNRMEEKVEALEAAAEVSAEMGSVGGNMLPGSSASSLEKEFKALESSDSVDDELQKLKGMLNPGKSPKSSETKGNGNDKVDDELEKLKKNAGL